MKKFILIIFLPLLLGCISKPNTSSVHTVPSQDTTINPVTTTAPIQETTRKKTPEETWAYYITTNDSYPRVIIMNEAWRIEKSAFEKNTVPSDTRTRKYLPYGNGCFVITLSSDRIYKFNDRPFFAENIEFIGVDYYDFEKQEWFHKAGSFFNVNGTPVKHSIQILSDNITEQKTGEYVFYSFTKEGKASFLITIWDENTQLDIDVISLPFGLYTPVDTVIEKLGFPDADKEDGVSWPDSKWVYGFFFNPDAGRSIYKHFYFYKKFPYLVLSKSSFDDTIDGVAYEFLED